MTDPDATEATRPKRRFLRLSLRALMIAVLIFAGVLGWVVSRARVQREAVAAIERKGGSVFYDYQYLPNWQFNQAGKPAWPKWLVNWLGVDYFGNVVSVMLGKSANDADMAHVGRLSHIKSFSNWGATEITDAGAAHLAGLIHLEFLQLYDTKVTGASLVHFRDMTNLKLLRLNGVDVTDADLAHLAGLTKLETLHFTSTSISDAGLGHLSKLVKMWSLQFYATQVEGPGLAHLKGMTNLRQLMLTRSRVADLSSLPPLPALSVLNLSENPITDDGFAAITRLESLSNLGLAKTHVTEVGLAHLQKLKKMQVITLSDTPVNPKIASALAKVKGLNKFDLSGSGLTDAGLAELIKNPNLISLKLKRTPITDAGLDLLANSSNLWIIDLEGTATTEAGLARLKKSLPKLETVQELAERRAQSIPKAQPTKPGSQP